MCVCLCLIDYFCLCVCVYVMPFLSWHGPCVPTVRQKPNPCCALTMDCLIVISLIFAALFTCLSICALVCLFCVIPSTINIATQCIWTVRQKPNPRCALTIDHLRPINILLFVCLFVHVWLIIFVCVFRLFVYVYVMLFLSLHGPCVPNVRQKPLWRCYTVLVLCTLSRYVWAPIPQAFREITFLICVCLGFLNLGRCMHV